MLNEVFEVLSVWLEKRNKESQEERSISIDLIEIFIIGQTALLEANLHIHLNATMDVDLSHQLEFFVKKKFNEILERYNKHLDPVGHEAWMPKETQYDLIYESSRLKGYIAKPVYIIASKAKMAPDKNKDLVLDYLNSEDYNAEFENLVEKYKINMEPFGG